MIYFQNDSLQDYGWIPSLMNYLSAIEFEETVHRDIIFVNFLLKFSKGLYRAIFENSCKWLFLKISQETKTFWRSTTLRQDLQKNFKLLL